MALLWQEPWAALPESARTTFQQQLAYELVPGHPLFGQKLTPVGRHSATDDVLLELADTRLSVVHLTWAGPGNGRYPLTTFFVDWADFTAGRMGPDALDYV
jgi:hypothetical protein